MDADGKIVAVDIEGDFDILGPMAEPGGSIKPLHLAAGQDDLPHGLLVAGASLQPVPQMDGGKLVLIGADDAVVALGTIVTSPGEPESRARTVASAVTREAA